MKLSVIIPTHNRAPSLQRAILSLAELRNETDFELVIVDNNSTDNTPSVVERFADFSRYVFEPNTAFSKARRTGGEHATGDVLLYLDDDVVVHPGALREILAVFSRYDDCGVIAGKILPRYESPPPDWALACQRCFNGWSLYEPATFPELGAGFQTVDSACGPMMAIRRKAYQAVDGFPPDTVGVETNTQGTTFRKLYIGPGDWGLCNLIKDAGYKVYYSPLISCEHVIPPMRFTGAFWRSRMIGEGHCLAITNRQLLRFTRGELQKRRELNWGEYDSWRTKFLRRLKRIEKFVEHPGTNGMLHEELWVLHFLAYLEMDTVLRKYPDLSKFLWEIGANGVANRDFTSAMAKLPKEYLDLTSPDHMYYERLICKGLADRLESVLPTPDGFLWTCRRIKRQIAKMVRP